MRSFLASAVLALTLGACGPTYTMTDDLDLTWDFELTPTRFDDLLHGPYVQGTAVTVYAYSSDDHPDFRGWSITSGDPAVFAIDHVSVATDGSSISATGKAVGEGHAALALLDDHGHQVGSGDAEVVAPDRVELANHGSLILGRDDEADVTEARMVAGGQATYLVRYFRGDRELHGNGVLSVAPPAGVTATPRTTFLFENREWLTLDATTAMTGTLQLLANGQKVAMVPIAVVPATDVVDIVILTQSEKNHHEGDWLVALAQAYDDAGRRVFGVDYQWHVEGQPQLGEGDLYRYHFKPGAYQMVQASYSGHTDAVMIQSDMGFVDSTNNVGCAAGGDAAAGAGLVWLGMIGLGLGRRRRVTA